MPQNDLLYRCNFLKAYSSGRDNTYLEPPNQNSLILPNWMARELLSCTHFETLDRHARAISSRLSLKTKIMVWPSLSKMHYEMKGFVPLGFTSFEKMIEGVLSTCAQKQALVSRLSFSRLLSSLYQNPSSPSPISSIGVVTHERPGHIRTWITSLRENITRWNRSISYLVMDDSRCDSSKSATMEALRDSAKNDPTSVVRYASLNEKKDFVSALIKKGLPEEILEFAFFDPLKLGYTYGANMNALLVDSVNELFINIDDDVECRTAKPPLQNAGLKLGSNVNPCRTWFFPTREKALKSVIYEDWDFIGLHEAYLGQFIGDCCIRDQARFDINVQDMPDVLFKQLLSQQGRVVGTHFGLVGDSGSNSPISYLFSDEEQKQRLFHDQQTYEWAMTTREICKSPTETTLQRARGFMPTISGLDNRDILPPFFPNFRNSDQCFGELIGLSQADAYFAYLPWVLVHNPTESRFYSNKDIHGFGQPFTPEHATRLILKNFFQEPHYRTTQNNLIAIGKHIYEMASLKENLYREYFSELIMAERAQTILNFEIAIQTTPDAPSAWTTHMKACLADAINSQRKPIVFAPFFMINEFGHVKAEQLVKQLLIQYGELITWWPAIIDASKELKKNGRRLSVSLI